MSVAVTYPGVYTSIITSPNPPTVGIATSVTLMVGRAPIGPLLQPITIFSYQDYIRQFGGLNEAYPLSYAVYQFFNNGGGQAVIVRVLNSTDQPITVGTVVVPVDTAYITIPASTDPFLVAAAPGTAYGKLVLTLSYSAVQPKGAPAGGYLYDLQIKMMVTSSLTLSEQYTGIKSVPAMSAGQTLAQVAAQSSLITLPVDSTGKPLPPVDPGVTATAPVTGATTGGADGGALAATDYQGAVTSIPLSMLYNIVVLPPDDPITWDTLGPAIYQGVAQLVVNANAFLIVDPLQKWEALAAQGKYTDISLETYPALDENQSESAAVFFPRILAPDPLSPTGAVQTYYPSAFMAGAFAQMDSNVGVWAAAAGLSSPINGAVGLTVEMTDPNNGILYVQGINCLRTFNIGGTVPWGARTLRGAPALADQYNVIPVRRLALYVAQWVTENTRWAVFKPNDEVLWSALRAQVTTFLTGIWNGGGLFGTSASQAFFVKCDATTTTTADMLAGIVNINIGFAPVRPAEFVVITIQQSYSTGAAS